MYSLAKKQLLNEMHTSGVVSVNDLSPEERQKCERLENKYMPLVVDALGQMEKVLVGKNTAKYVFSIDPKISSFSASDYNGLARRVGKYDVVFSPWRKGDFFRLYITAYFDFSAKNLRREAAENKKPHDSRDSKNYLRYGSASVSFGFVNLKTGRYSCKRGRKPAVDYKASGAEILSNTDILEYADEIVDTKDRLLDMLDGEKYDDVTGAEEYNIDYQELYNTVPLLAGEDGGPDFVAVLKTGYISGETSYLVNFETYRFMDIDEAKEADGWISLDDLDDDLNVK